MADPFACCCSTSIAMKSCFELQQRSTHGSHQKDHTDRRVTFKIARMFHNTEIVPIAQAHDYGFSARPHPKILNVRFASAEGASGENLGF